MPICLYLSCQVRQLIDLLPQPFNRQDGTAPEMLKLPPLRSLLLELQPRGSPTLLDVGEAEVDRKERQRKLREEREDSGIGQARKVNTSSKTLNKAEEEEQVLLHLLNSYSQTRIHAQKSRRRRRNRPSIGLSIRLIWLPTTKLFSTD
jgi:hypothetical protein